MNCPCKDCITLPICKQKFKEMVFERDYKYSTSLTRHFSLYKFSNTCVLLSKYVSLYRHRWTPGTNIMVLRILTKGIDYGYWSLPM